MLRNCEDLLALGSAVVGGGCKNPLCTVFQAFLYRIYQQPTPNSAAVRNSIRHRSCGVAQLQYDENGHCILVGNPAFIVHHDALDQVHMRNLYPSMP